MKQILYVITDGEHFKFGIAMNVFNRVRGLQTGNARRLNAIALMTHPKINEHDTEQHIHAFLRPYRLCGEWFDGSALRVQTIVEHIKTDDYRGIYKMIEAYEEANNEVVFYRRC